MALNMADIKFDAKQYLDISGLKKFWGIVKTYISDNLTWTNIYGKPDNIGSTSGSAIESGEHNHTTTFSGTKHNHTFSGNQLTTNTESDHVHSVTASGTIESKFSGTKHNHTGSTSVETIDNVNLVGSVNDGVLTLSISTSSTNKSLGVTIADTTAGGTVTSTFTGTEVSTTGAGSHSHTATPTGTIADTTAGGTVKCEKSGKHSHTVEVDSI